MAIKRQLSVVDNSQDLVQVTVVEVIGSSPREVGALMLVSQDEVSGTIGGGTMEYSAIEFARSVLQQQANGLVHSCRDGAVLATVLLNPKNDQCCGGKVELMYECRLAGKASSLEALLESLQHQQKKYCELTLANYQSGRQSIKLIVTSDQVYTFFDGERYDDTNGAFNTKKFDLNLAATANCSIMVAQEKLSLGEHQAFLHRTVDENIWVGQFNRPNDFNITLYGAGHVAKALVHILSANNCHIRWIDSRKDVFPDDQYSNVEMIHDAVPSRTVFDAPPGSYFLVMTHSHQLDFDLCDHILARDDVRYLGLIGSVSKAQRFRNQFERRGLSQKELGLLTCPIGIEGIKSKNASAIAVSIAAQLLLLYDSAVAENNRHQVPHDDLPATHNEISYGWETLSNTVSINQINQGDSKSALRSAKGQSKSNRR